MKNYKYLVSISLLMLFSFAAWSFTPGFDSANPATIMQFIEGNNVFIYLGSFFLLGILLAFTPCVLPMVPILSGIIVGQKMLSTTRAVKLSMAYVLGMSVTYAVAGMLAGYMGSTVQTMMQRPAVIIVYSLLFVVMALSMFGLFELRLPTRLNAKLQSFNPQSNRKNFISIALMGVISTLIVSPCVTVPLIGVLTYIGQNGQVFMGGFILFVMALGMGLPLILVGAGYGSLLPKTGMWMNKIKQLFGLIMLGLAIWMLARVLPEKIINFLWAALLIFGSLGLGSLRSSQGIMGKLMQALGVVALCGGSIVLYNTFIQKVETTSEQVAALTAPFKEVNTLVAIEEQIALAKQDGKPVFLEFSASWCSDCQEMDNKVFNQSNVAQAMQGLVNVRVDISDKNSEIAKIKEAFGIYGTPTMLFLDKDGKKINDLTAVGVIHKNQMIDLLNSAKSGS